MNYLTWIRKTALPGRRCRNTGYRVVFISHALSAVDIAKHPFLPLLVFSSTSKGLSGSSPYTMFIAQVDFRDLSQVRSTGLAALQYEGAPLGPMWGHVYTGDLAVDFFGNLTVTGSFTGYIPGMTGSGNNYRAFYPHFVFTPAGSASPSSVIAY